MPLMFEVNNTVFLTALAGGWGAGCAVFERFLLAPRRRLSAIGPAYAPAMVLALFVGGTYATHEGNSFVLALLIAGISFVLISVPVLVSFHVMRRLLRTRFSAKANTKSVEAARDEME